jgi:hypothetical protein
MEVCRQGCGCQRSRRALHEREPLAVPVRVVAVYEEGDLVEGEAGSRPEGHAQPESAPVATGQDRGAAGGKDEPDPGEIVVYAHLLLPQRVVGPSRPAPQSRRRTASFPHVVDGARYADRGGERAQHSKSRSLGRRNAPITATECRHGRPAVHAAVHAVRRESLRAPSRNSVDTTRDGGPDRRCCRGIWWCAARRCRTRGRATAACLTRRRIRRRSASSGTCQSRKSTAMSRPCLFSREGATSPRGGRAAGAQPLGANSGSGLG